MDKAELINIMVNQGAIWISENKSDVDIMFSRPSIFGLAYLWAFWHDNHYHLGCWTISSNKIIKIMSTRL